MTPREPDRFDAQALTVEMECGHLRDGTCLACLDAALRAAESSALERAAQEAERRTDPIDRGQYAIAERIRALIPPAAAPAGEGPLDKMKRALDEKVRMERERYASFCEAVAAGSAEDRAIAMAAPAAETGKAQGVEALLRECEKVIRKLGHPRTCWYWRYDGMADDRRDINMRGDCDCGADALLKKLTARTAPPEGEGT